MHTEGHGWFRNKSITATVVGILNLPAVYGQGQFFVDQRCSHSTLLLVRGSCLKLYIASFCSYHCFDCLLPPNFHMISSVRLGKPSLADVQVAAIVGCKTTTLGCTQMVHDLGIEPLIVLLIGSWLPCLSQGSSQTRWRSASVCKGYVCSQRAAHRQL